MCLAASDICCEDLKGGKRQAGLLINKPYASVCARSSTVDVSNVWLRERDRRRRRLVSTHRPAARCTARPWPCRLVPAPNVDWEELEISIIRTHYIFNCLLNPKTNRLYKEPKSHSRCFTQVLGSKRIITSGVCWLTESIYIHKLGVKNTLVFTSHFLICFRISEIL